MRIEQFVTSSTGVFWKLSSLAVAPDFRTNGIGTALMQWDMQRAVEDQVLMIMSATEDGAFLYRKLGFRDAGEDRIFVTGREIGNVRCLDGILRLQIKDLG